MKKTIGKYTAVMFLILFAFGCKPTTKTVEGIYFARHNKGTESIEFKGDSTYIHILKKGAEEKKQSGTWKITEDNMIIINNWITWVSPKENDPSLNAEATVVVPYNDNAIIMFVDDDNYNFFKK